MVRAARRYGPRSSAPEAYAQIERELDVIAALKFPGYFLVVHDITQFCRRNDILCQGRGSAANSAVCYALGVTAVDPIANELLFERFPRRPSDGPPDIDIDIESDLRERAIQYVYDKYGRDYAAQVANVITYRGRSAVRDIARALGFSQGPAGCLESADQPLERAGRFPTSGHPRTGDRPGDADQNLPRHMGIHSGGMVICDRPIADVCPVEWARMADRSVLQWDKDDCAAIGLVKFDLLGLGMLSALHYAIDLIAEHKGIEVDLASSTCPIRRCTRCCSARTPSGVPGGVARPDGDAAPAEAAGVLRPGGGGGADPPRPHPGRFGAPCIRRRNGLEPVVTTTTRRWSRPCGRRWGAAVSGAADAARRGLCGFSPAEADSCAGPWVPSVPPRRCGGCGTGSTRGWRSGTDHRRGRRPNLREAGGLRQFRLPGEVIPELRLAGVLLLLVQAAPPGGVLRGPAAGPADGLLLTAVAGGRCAQARGHRARAGRQRQPGARHVRGRRTRGAAGVGAVRHIGDDLANASSTSEPPTARTASLLI